MLAVTDTSSSSRPPFRPEYVELDQSASIRALNAIAKQYDLVEGLVYAFTRCLEGFISFESLDNLPLTQNKDWLAADPVKNLDSCLDVIVFELREYDYFTGYKPMDLTREDLGAIFLDWANKLNVQDLKKFPEAMTYVDACREMTRTYFSMPKRDINAEIGSMSQINEPMVLKTGEVGNRKVVNGFTDLSLPELRQQVLQMAVVLQNTESQVNNFKQMRNTTMVSRVVKKLKRILKTVDFYNPSNSEGMRQWTGEMAKLLDKDTSASTQAIYFSAIMTAAAKIKSTEDIQMEVVNDSTATVTEEYHVGWYNDVMVIKQSEEFLALAQHINSVVPNKERVLLEDMYGAFKEHAPRVRMAGLNFSAILAAFIVLGLQPIVIKTDGMMEAVDDMSVLDNLPFSDSFPEYDLFLQVYMRALGKTQIARKHLDLPLFGWKIEDEVNQSTEQADIVVQTEAHTQETIDMNQPIKALAQVIQAIDDSQPNNWPSIYAALTEAERTAGVAEAREAANKLCWNEDDTVADTYIQYLEIAKTIHSKTTATLFAHEVSEDIKTAIFIQSIAQAEPVKKDWKDKTSSALFEFTSMFYNPLGIFGYHRTL